MKNGTTVLNHRVHIYRLCGGVDTVFILCCFLVYFFKTWETFYKSLPASLRGVLTLSGFGPHSGLSSFDRPLHRPCHTMHSCDNELCVCQRVCLGVKGEVC